MPAEVCLITKELAAPASYSLASVIENLVGEILITLALTYPEAVMLLAVMLVKLPMGLVTEVTALIMLALTFPLAEMFPEELNVVVPPGVLIFTAWFVVMSKNPLMDDGDILS